MIRRLFISAFALFLGFGAAMAADRTDVVDYFTCDFTYGMPEGTVLEDADGATLHFLMVQAGFDQGDSWKVLHERSTGNYYAASPSMHSVKAGEEPVAANDRMTLPPMLIRGGSALLTWRCRAYNDQSSTPSTYSVLVNGTTLIDSAEAPVSGWISMDASLEEWVGQRVSITFVNNTLDGEVLAIDDITVSGQPGVATIAIQPGSYAIGGETFKIGATFTASSDWPVTSVGVICSVDGKEYSAEESGLNLQRGESFTLLVDKEFSLEFGQTLDYVVTPTVNGVTYDAVKASTTPLAFLPKKCVVLEEGTGMWCGWCPLGIVATDSLRMAFGSDVIPIAIHFGQDLVAFDAYADALGISGAPYGKFDRVSETADPMPLVKEGRKESYTIWRGGFGTLARQRLRSRAVAEILADATLAADRKSAEINCSVRLAVDDPQADYRIALVMVEDNVWRPGYFQKNYLANYPERAPMGGFESMPENITSDFAYNHVARAVADNAFTGIKGSLPTAFKAGETHTWSKTMEIPRSVMNVANLQVVAMLINGADGSIVNACIVPVDKAGITAAGASVPETVEVSHRMVTVTSADGSTVSAALFDLTGRIVASASAPGAVTLSAPSGIYLLRTPSTALKVALYPLD